MRRVEIHNVRSPSLLLSLSLQCYILILRLILKQNAFIKILNCLIIVSLRLWIANVRTRHIIRWSLYSWFLLSKLWAVLFCTIPSRLLLSTIYYQRTLILSSRCIIWQIIIGTIFIKRCVSSCIILFLRSNDTVSLINLWLYDKSLAIFISWILRISRIIFSGLSLSTVSILIGIRLLCKCLIHLRIINGTVNIRLISRWLIRNTLLFDFSSDHCYVIHKVLYVFLLWELLYLDVMG